MKGVILEGGLGTRLYPLTYATNKHLLPVYDKPMIYYPIQTLTKAGIYQNLGDGGIADALKLAKSFADEKPITVILGDNCTDTDISQEVKNFKDGAVIFLKEVDDPQRFGIAELDHVDNTKVVGIEEKPSKPKSNLAVTGVY